jgi:hypothetical protein
MKWHGKRDERIIKSTAPKTRRGLCEPVFLDQVVADAAHAILTLLDRQVLP